MRTCFAASVVLLLSASVAAEAPNPKRVTRLVAATLALLPRTSKVLTTVFTEVSPADCPGARKTFNKVLQFSAKDKKLLGELEEAMAQANEADRKSADERLMSEHAAKVQPVMIVLFQLEPRKNMFKKACPSEYSELSALLKPYKSMLKGR
jgi:hypothetical protein